MGTNAALNNNHMTALMISCMMGNWDLIQMLVEEFGADLDGPISRVGWRAIDYAAAEGFRFPNEHPIVEYLKSQGSQHTWWGAVRNCSNADTHEMKWSTGRGDSFYYK